MKNGEATLVSCLDTIISQTIVENIQIIVLDSGSIDKSVSIAQSFGATVINIEPSQFNHGLTRNLGVEHANGELLFFTVQDAELSSLTQLEKMMSHFRNEEVQAVVGIQGYPHHEDKNPALWFRQIDEPKIESRHYPNGEFEKLNQTEQFAMSNWDNVNAMYRKSTLLEIPFVKTNFSEDWIWANSALKSGKLIMKDSSLLVWHYHHMNFTYTLRSKFIVYYYFSVFFGQKPLLKIKITPFLRRCYTLFFTRKSLSFRSKIFWTTHNFLYFIGDLLAKFLFYFSVYIGKSKGLELSYKLLLKKTPQGKLKK